MTVYIPCEDPRVLAEHQDANGRAAVEVWYPRRKTWEVSLLLLADDFAHQMDRCGERYRLVFSSPEEAGRGLVDYARRLGAVVEYQHAGGEGWRRSWAATEPGGDARVRGMLDSGHAYRIAAPAAPAEEPEHDTPPTRQEVREVAERVCDASRRALAEEPRPEPDPGRVWLFDLDDPLCKALADGLWLAARADDQEAFGDLLRRYVDASMRDGAP